jgi:hypothetical protein
VIYHDTETRSLLAREHVELLASEMRRAKRPASAEPAKGDSSRVVAWLEALAGRLRRSRHYEAPVYER